MKGGRGQYYLLYSRNTILVSTVSAVVCGLAIEPVEMSGQLVTFAIVHGD